MVDPGFPREEGANPKGGRKPTIWPIFSEGCMKMKKFWAGGGAPPLDPPLFDHYKFRNRMFRSAVWTSERFFLQAWINRISFSCFEEEENKEENMSGEGVVTSQVVELLMCNYPCPWISSVKVRVLCQGGVWGGWSHL